MEQEPAPVVEGRFEPWTLLTAPQTTAPGVQQRGGRPGTWGRQSQCISSGPSSCFGRRDVCVCVCVGGTYSGHTLRSRLHLDVEDE